MYYPEDQLQPLFNSYDRDGSGSLDYTEFAVAVFGEEASNKGQMQRKPPIQAKAYVSCQSFYLLSSFFLKLIKLGFVCF